jgi:hypothetical protein
LAVKLLDDDILGSTDANRRFEIRKSRRGMSFVRAGREIETVDAFPRSMHDIESGLGRWPLLQSFAYHWGVEVRFTPALDDVFGITNDKQGVRPIEDFWRVLSKHDIDLALRRENAWQRDMRDRRAKSSTPPSVDVPTPAELAAQAVDVAEGRSAKVVPDRLKPRDAEALAKMIAARVTPGTSMDDLRATIRREARRRPYRIEYADNPHAPFYEPDWIGNQILIRVNGAHSFYRVFYSHLLRLAGASHAKESLDLLLIALAGAELSVEVEAQALWYQTQRSRVWSPWLETSLRALEQRAPASEEEMVTAADATGATSTTSEAEPAA